MRALMLMWNETPWIGWSLVHGGPLGACCVPRRKIVEFDRNQLHFSSRDDGWRGMSTIGTAEVVGPAGRLIGGTKSAVHAERDDVDGKDRALAASALRGDVKAHMQGASHCRELP